MRNFLIALVLLLWLILGWLYYQDYNKCCGNTKQDSSTPVLSEKTGPILFNWGISTPILGDGWPRMRDSLAMFASDSSSLEIAGFYCMDASPEETESTGLNRAMETRKLFPEIPDDRIIILSKSIDCDSSFKSSRFESVSFSLRKRTENIKEIDDRTLIYFPPNSTNKLNSVEVEAYLDDVAERVTKSGETVLLTGHTDAVGPAESNIVLGQKRANIIRDYLLGKGIAADKIRSTSKGEAEPLGENDTASGKAKNRRTELQIIK
ncbi:MAG: OmpA family protein [Saprospiraceae bacterium]|jgi:outer membrane protein OmpA-like peptidoglycan-associated protein|nr:OmpA family protein [Saprospiraceae bacterium]MBP6566227.1 OmpA family protein [Saprospiraceae bacterium]